MEEYEEQGAEAHKLNIVLMTRQGDPFGLDVLAEFRNRGRPIAVTVLERDSPKREFARFRRLLRQLGPVCLWRRVLDRAFHTVRQQLAQVQRKSHRSRSYEALCESIVRVDNLNESPGVLRDLKHDIVVLGGARILRKEVIDMPTIGILNAHPGLLPQYRGLDAIEWAILNGDDVGVTVHLVDEGIDTGPIVIKEKLEIQPENRLADLKRRASKLSVQLMADAVDLIAAGRASPQTQREADGRLYSSMPGALHEEVDRKLAVLAASSARAARRSLASGASPGCRGEEEHC